MHCVYSGLLVFDGAFVVFVYLMRFFYLIFFVCFVIFLFLSLFFFFFSSRRRHTRCLSDWSSDVCSSDLRAPSLVRRRSLGDHERAVFLVVTKQVAARTSDGALAQFAVHLHLDRAGLRSEERRVGKECRLRE